MRYIDLNELLKKKTTWGKPAELWTDKTLKKDFRDYFFNKCWYSEASLAMTDVDIDHFRPKAEVIQFEGFDYNSEIARLGYYWLKNNPSNYRASSKYSNEPRGEGGKRAYFPLMSGSPHMTEHGHEIEEPMLLDPCSQDDVELLTFFEGDAVAMPGIDSDDTDRVDVSIKLYNLNEPGILSQRKQIWQQAYQHIDNYENGDISLAACLRYLKDMVDKKSPYSACAISCIKGMAPDEIVDALNLAL